MKQITPRDLLDSVFSVHGGRRVLFPLHFDRRFHLLVQQPVLLRFHFPEVRREEGALALTAEQLRSLRFPLSSVLVEENHEVRQRVDQVVWSV